VPFPFLNSTASSSSSKGDLWSNFQLFLEEWTKIDAGNGVEREEMIRRQRLKNKGERTMVLLYSMAVKTVEQRAQEKKDAQMRNEQGLEDTLEKLHLGDKTTMTTMAAPVVTGPLTVIHGVRINVAGIRVIKQKRHVREHEHAVSV
jgi:hypothetical protein